MGDEPGSNRRGLVPHQSMHMAISTACRLLDSSGVASGLRCIGPLPLSSCNEDLKAAKEAEIAAGQAQIFGTSKGPHDVDGKCSMPIPDDVSEELAVLSGNDAHD